MKSIGIVRKVDELGRIVIPMELRKTLLIDKKDPLEIFVDDDTIILKKYEPACVLCGESKNIIEFKSKKLCADCIKEISEKV